MFEYVMKEVQKLNPIVHCITNYVTANDVANALLAIGGRPIMADDINEVSEITTLTNALLINMGTLNPSKLKAMVASGKMANRLNHPIVLDPVGIGASKFRNQAAKILLQEVNFSVIKGNISEIKALAKNMPNLSGVDASNDDKITVEKLDDTIKFIQEFANKTRAIIVVTGKNDLIVDSQNAYLVKNGCTIMSKISGTGCMLGGILGAFITCGQSNLLETVAYTTALMGYCGEIADQKIRNEDKGTGSFKVYLIDALNTINYHQLKVGVKIESF